MRSAHIARLALVVSVAVSGCAVRWPSEPYLETASRISGPVGPELAKAGSERAGPVYRRYLEKERADREVVEQWFLYRDASGQNRRGSIGQTGDFTSRQVTFADRLPAELDRAFFRVPAGLAPGGEVSGRVWRWKEAGRNTTVHEFEFTCGGRHGIGRISEPGPEASACFILGP